MAAQSDFERDECGATGGGNGIKGEEARESTISDLATIIQAHIGQQKTREAQWDREVARQDQRFRALQHQFSLLQLQVQSRTDSRLEPALSQSLQVTNSPADASAQTALPSTPLPAENSQGVLRFTREPKFQKSLELQVWIKEHDPKMAAKAASLADMFVAARSKNQRPSLVHQDTKSSLSVGKLPVKENQTKTFKLPVCYLCGQEGHTKPRCPQNTVKLTHMCCVPRQKVKQQSKPQYPLKMTTVEINGQDLKALIDTGSTQTLVHKQYVPPYAIRPTDTVPICCVHGDERTYPTADVYIKVEGQMYLLNVGVTDNLQFPVVLGHDLPVLLDLIKPVQTCNAALTRAQVKQMEDPVKTLSALPFYNAEIETESSKPHKSRR